MTPMQKQEVCDWSKMAWDGIRNPEQWLEADIRTGIINTFLEFYVRMWDKCASNVLSIVWRTHLSRFQFVANKNVYEHIRHTSWGNCAPRQICCYRATLSTMPETNAKCFNKLCSICALLWCWYRTLLFI
jgi:hypothetical protein